MLRNKRGRDSERSAHRDEEWPPLAATRESPRTETKTRAYLSTPFHSLNRLPYLRVHAVSSKYHVILVNPFFKIQLSRILSTLSNTPFPKKSHASSSVLHWLLERVCFSRSRYNTALSHHLFNLKRLSLDTSWQLSPPPYELFESKYHLSRAFLPPGSSIGATHSKYSSNVDE